VLTLVKVNKVIELLSRGQPVYAIGVRELTYDVGRQHAQTWADLILVDFEHWAHKEWTSNAYGYNNIAFQLY
jgi:hypothetical protein